MSYAQGKYSYGVCDRCGFRIQYLKMRMEWTGFKVCQQCYEPKHPQLEPPVNATDPEALRQPRPEVSLPQSQQGRVFTTGPSNTAPGSGVNVGGQPLSVVDPIGCVFKSVFATGEIGEVTVTTT